MTRESCPSVLTFHSIYISAKGLIHPVNSYSSSKALLGCPSSRKPSRRSPCSPLWVPISVPAPAAQAGGFYWTGSHLRARTHPCSGPCWTRGRHDGLLGEGGQEASLRRAPRRGEAGAARAGRVRRAMRGRPQTQGVGLGGWAHPPPLPCFTFPLSTTHSLPGYAISLISIAY